MQLFRETFFENPKRFNIKIHAKSHWDDEETRQKSIDLNKVSYGADGPCKQDLTIVDVKNRKLFQRQHQL